MTKERIAELRINPEAKLTDEEIADGWYFCNCEWDGMLIRMGGKEAQICHCRSKWNTPASLLS